jgi:hypothetical protein
MVEEALKVPLTSIRTKIVEASSINTLEGEGGTFSQKYHESA